MSSPHHTEDTATPEDDVRELRKALDDREAVVSREGDKTLGVPYEQYRRALDAYTANCFPDRIRRILDRLEAAEKKLRELQDGHERAN